MSSGILALDFDGVICDSLPECFVSGTLAAAGGSGQEALSELVDQYRQGTGLYREFYRWRPFVRSGEDYVLIAGHLAKGGKAPVCQEDMDRYRSEAGAARLEDFKKSIYRVREELLSRQEALWLDLNPLMPPLAPFLPALSAREDVWILSTKRPAFIKKILEHHGIPWPEARILEASGESKLAVMDRTWGDLRLITFWDDQPDHFHGLPARITCVLPSWGYILPSWLRGLPGCRVIGAEAVSGELAPWTGGSVL